MYKVLYVYVYCIGKQGISGNTINTYISFNFTNIEVTAMGSFFEQPCTAYARNKRK